MNGRNCPRLIKGVSCFQVLEEVLRQYARGYDHGQSVGLGFLYTTGSSIVANAGGRLAAHSLRTHLTQRPSLHY